MKSIMYHYVREKSGCFPYFRFLDAGDFSKQLDYFEHHFGFVSHEDFISSISTGVATEGVVLTFDDAFKDHYDFVFPELKKRGLWGVFYVPTKPYIDGAILDVHRIHLLLGRLGGNQLKTLLDEVVDETMLVDRRREEFDELTYRTQQGDQFESSVIVKRLLNYFIDYKYRSGVVDQLYSRTFDMKERNELENSFYLSTQELNEMSKNGMVIGSHTVSHPVLSKLDNQTQEKEISQSFDFLLDNVSGIPYKTFCYPHGGFHTFTDFTEKCLEELGVMYSFNVEARDIENSDLEQRKQALPRFDCNLFPHGQIRV